MKKLTLLFITTFVTLAAAAQDKYLQFGLHGGFGTTWMINNNVSDQGPNLDPQASFAGFGGIHAMASFAPAIGLQLEVNMATIKQKYKSEIGGIKTEGNDRAKYIEVPVLIILKSGAFYCEIGPKFSFLSSAKTEGTGISSFDTKNGFKNTVISAVLGLGGQFALTKQKNLMLNTGIRFAYGFSDATKEYSSMAVLNADDNTGIATNGAHYNQSGTFSYKATHIATGYIVLGMSYRIPLGKG